MNGPEIAVVPEHDDDQELMTVLRRIAGTSPRDIMEVRMIVEPKAAAVSAANARPADLVAIRNAHDLAVASIESGTFEAWDGEFHKRIFESTRNDFLTTLHDILNAIRMRENWVEIKRRTFDPEQRIIYCDEHAAIYAAIESRDPARAATEMRRHIRTISRNLF